MTTSRTRRHGWVGGWYIGFIVATGAVLVFKAPAAAAVGVLGLTDTSAAGIPDAMAWDTDLAAAPSDDDGSNAWWWLVIPFGLVFAGLVLTWLFRKLRRGRVTGGTDAAETAGQGVAAADRSDIDVENPEAATPDAAAAAGAAAAAAAMQDRAGDVLPEAGTAEPEDELAGRDAAADAGATAAAAALAERTDEYRETAAATRAAAAAAATAGGSTAGISEDADAGDIADPDAATGEPVAPGEQIHGIGDGVGHYVKDGVEVPVPLGAHLPLSDPNQPPEGYPIKGSAEDEEYHTAQMSTFDDASAEIWFASESAASSAGYSAAENGG
ncbi:hypothetical protein AAFP35_12615 [Gordonia sp. CPCC 206044]|uniref:sunset domain-containing protein n=1 Tax=Gordonia sp. CPCC 206044 TaxID=3140793 RepID=UPI003AF3EA6F